LFLFTFQQINNFEQNCLSEGSILGIGQFVFENLFIIMCFSATASFTAGAILTVTGIASIKKRIKKLRSLLPQFHLFLVFSNWQKVFCGYRSAIKYQLMQAFQ
jgi:hypothetical protein